MFYWKCLWSISKLNELKVKLSLTKKASVSVFRSQAIDAGVSCSNSYIICSIVDDARRKETIFIQAVRACVVTRECHAVRLKNNCIMHVISFWFLDDALILSVSSSLNNLLYLKLQCSLDIHYLTFNLLSVYFLVCFLNEYHSSSEFSWKKCQKTINQALKVDKSFLFSFLCENPCVVVDLMKS